MTEQWNFIPRVVEELAKLEGTANGSVSLSKEELCREAVSCKQIYEVELGNFKDDLLVEKKKKFFHGLKYLQFLYFTFLHILGSQTRDPEV